MRYTPRQLSCKGMYMQILTLNWYQHGSHWKHFITAKKVYTTLTEETNLLALRILLMYFMFRMFKTQKTLLFMPALYRCSSGSAVTLISVLACANKTSPSETIFSVAKCMVPFPDVTKKDGGTGLSREYNWFSLLDGECSDQPQIHQKEECIYLYWNLWVLLLVFLESPGYMSAWSKEFQYPASLK